MNIEDVMAAVGKIAAALSRDFKDGALVSSGAVMTAHDWLPGDHMNIGMLWFDNDPKTTLAAKISRAAAYYQSKYGQSPNLCFVHPSMYDPAVKPEDVTLKPSRSIMPNHFWLGVDR